MSCWRQFDAGAEHASPAAKKRDCQVRALCTALAVSYPEAWEMLYAMQGERKACDFQLVEALHEGCTALNVIRELPFPAVRGKKRMTAMVFCRKHKTGHFILRMAHHVAAVKDGVLLDTSDSSSACVYTAWEIRPRAKSSSWAVSTVPGEAIRIGELSVGPTRAGSLARPLTPQEIYSAQAFRDAHTMTTAELAGKPCVAPGYGGWCCIPTCAPCRARAHREKEAPRHG